VSERFCKVFKAVRYNHERAHAFPVTSGQVLFLIPIVPHLMDETCKADIGFHEDFSTTLISTVIAARVRDLRPPWLHFGFQNHSNTAYESAHISPEAISDALHGFPDKLCLCYGPLDVSSFVVTSAFQNRDLSPYVWSQRAAIQFSI